MGVVHGVIPSARSDVPVSDRDGASYDEAQLGLLNLPCCLRRGGACRAQDGCTETGMLDVNFRGEPGA